MFGDYNIRLIPDSFQSRVSQWVIAIFGAEIAADKVERNARFLEEALELVQACECSRAEAHFLVDYVYDRAIGDAPQEVGGVMITLAALCESHGINLDAEKEIELRRVWGKMLEIKSKQAAKPKFMKEKSND